ncbi:hypothetical protein HCDG_05693 [Histoplasma capsulatum H143]|uniref:Uncharacterized protein n=1 Tax=Ajellomyces capsulatus (strain H143) TaxID=544712 RepID=C6HHL2_AJECH|nr:hypothetical protein HCDG_05693 [Histoplasma capsulatum H143]
MLGSASPSAFLRLATFLADDHYAFRSQLTLDKIARVLKSLTQATKSRESISWTTKHDLLLLHVPTHCALSSHQTLRNPVLNTGVQFTIRKSQQRYLTQLSF